MVILQIICQTVRWLTYIWPLVKKDFGFEQCFSFYAFLSIALTKVYC